MKVPLSFLSLPFQNMHWSMPSRHMTSKWRRIDVSPTPSRRIDVNTTSFQRRVPAGWVNVPLNFAVAETRVDGPGGYMLTFTGLWL